MNIEKITLPDKYLEEKNNFVRSNEIYDKRHRIFDNKSTDHIIYTYGDNYKKEILQRGEINTDYFKYILERKKFDSPVRRKYLNYDYDFRREELGLKKIADKAKENKAINEINKETNENLLTSIAYKMKHTNEINDLGEFISSIPVELSNIIADKENLTIINKNRVNQINNEIKKRKRRTRRQYYRCIEEPVLNRPEKKVYTEEEIFFNKSYYPIINNIHELII